MEVSSISSRGKVEVYLERYSGIASLLCSMNGSGRRGGHRAGAPPPPRLDLSRADAGRHAEFSWAGEQRLDAAAPQPQDAEAAAASLRCCSWFDGGGALPQFLPASPGILTDRRAPYF